MALLYIQGLTCPMFAGNLHPMKGTLKHLFIKEAHKAPMVPVQTAEAITLKGLKGDVAFGKNRRQVLLIEQEALDEFDLEPGIIRENGVTAGIVLAGLPKGSTVQLGSVVLEVTMDCDPCPFMETIREGLEKAMDGRRGTLFRVLEGGTMTVGDPVSVTPYIPSP